MANFGPNGASDVATGAINNNGDISTGATALWKQIATTTSSSGNALNDITGSSYLNTGGFAVSRPGYSSGGFCINVGGSVGTYQFASSYSDAMYRRNATDNNTSNWSSWRQID